MLCFSRLVRWPQKEVGKKHCTGNEISTTFATSLWSPDKCTSLAVLKIDFCIRLSLVSHSQCRPSPYTSGDGEPEGRRQQQLVKGTPLPAIHIDTNSCHLSVRASVCTSRLFAPAIIGLVTPFVRKIWWISLQSSVLDEISGHMGVRFLPSAMQEGACVIFQGVFFCSGDGESSTAVGLAMFRVICHILGGWAVVDHLMVPETRQIVANPSHACELRSTVTCSRAIVFRPVVVVVYLKSRAASSLTRTLEAVSCLQRKLEMNLAQKVVLHTEANEGKRGAFGEALLCPSSCKVQAD